jgi:site-specific DNA-cytosine methylase
MRDRLYWCNWNVSQPEDRGIKLQDILDQGGEALKSKAYTLLENYSSAGPRDYSHRHGEIVGIAQRPHGFGVGGFFVDKSPTLTANGKFQDNNHVAIKEKAYCLGSNCGKMTEQNFTKGQGELVSIALKDKSYPLKASDAKRCAADVKRPSWHGTNTIQIGSLYDNNAQAGRIYSTEGKSVGLRANAGGGGGQTGLYKLGENVRKLTPRECCRLQTYDERVFDLFCTNKNEAMRGKPYMSKSAFYNVFGDSFTVDVIVHILKCNKELMALC